MSGIKDQENIEELRRRLYERSFSGTQNVNRASTLSKSTVDVSRGWGNPRPVLPPIPEADESVAKPETQTKSAAPILDPAEFEIPKKRHGFRKFALIGSIAVFVIAAAVSSVYLFFGANQISGKNISIDVAAPSAIAAGEKMTMQVNIANQNSVPIESATLIINYPGGTKAADEEGKDLFEARIPIEVIASGEARTVQVQAVLFGEENEEKEVKVAVEYRVAGSNSTFFKEAEIKRIKINSSPLVIRVNSVEKVSSGQELEIKLTVQSNAPVVQRNILVQASYPNTFTFESAEPSPAYSQNEWLIKEIAPEESTVITLRGKVNGVAGEPAEIHFEAGTPQSDNQFMMGSALTKTKANYIIESAFLEVEVVANGDDDGVVVVEPGKETLVVVRVINTLAESVYDLRVEVAPKGNLIRDQLVKPKNGFYDAAKQTIVYEIAGIKSLSEIKSGEVTELEFTVFPDPKQTTAAFDVSTKVFARRVREARAAEELIGSATAEIKYSSALDLVTEVGRETGPFVEVGQIPPVAGSETTYTLTFEALAGVNDVTGGVLTATLPQYVNWKDVYEAEGAVTFNPVAKQFKWEVGTMTAGTKKRLQIQIGLLPSVTQVGTTPTIMGRQDFRANDRFTGANLQVIGQALVAELSREAGYSDDSGRVVAP